MLGLGKWVEIRVKGEGIEGRGSCRSQATGADIGRAAQRSKERDVSDWRTCWEWGNGK